MSLIGDDLNEMNKITAEIKRLSATLKSLKETKKIIQTRMTRFLKERDFEGGKVGNSVILLKEKTVRKAKPKKDLQADLSVFFSKHGIQNPEAFMKELRETSNDTIVKSVIKINPIK